MSKPKVECRARHSGMYSRAGHLWNSEFQEIPKEILKDEERTQLLQDDPHLEIRVDGKFVTGPRAGTLSAEAAAIADQDRTADENAGLLRTIGELRTARAAGAKALEAANAELAKSNAELAKANASIADLTAQLKAASKPAPAVTPVSGVKGDDSAPPKG